MQIYFWEDSQGSCPVAEFLKDRHNVEVEILEKVNKKFDLFEKYPFQHLVRAEILKKFDNHKNLYEIKLPIKKTEYRFLGALENDQILLVHAFKKKKNKTELRHIKTALDRLKKLNV